MGYLLLLLPWLGEATIARSQQVTPAIDGTGTIVMPNGSQFTITGGTTSRDGTNLFHSFQQFGLSQNQIATFLANPTIQNILGRVVGGDPSVINGLIQVTGGNANLFLMNPAGIVFGTNASLNVPASFTATTANSIGFGNQRWNAVGPNDYANLVGLPTSFTFGMSQAGAIVNAGNLAVPDAQNLVLLGGTVVNTGSLSAPGGQITVAAVPGTNLVRLSQPGSLLNLEFVPLASSASPLPSPLSLPQLLTGGNLSNSTGLTVNANGQVELTGSQVQIPAGMGSTTIAGSINASGQTGGTVQVLGDRVGLFGASISASGIGNGGTVLMGGDYQGKGVVPNASRTDVSRDSRIDASSILKGDGGRVVVWANEATGFYGAITARGGTTSGNGGFAEVSGKQNLIFDGNVDLTAVNGIGGTLLLDPTDIVISNGSTPGTTITQATLQAMPGTMDVLLEATNNIVIGTLDIVDLDRTSGVDNRNGLQFAAAPSFGTGTAGTITFRADSDNDGAGSFLMPELAPDGKRQILQATGRNVAISGANIILGDVNTDNFGLNAAPISLTASGNIFTGTLSAITTSDNTSGGDITLTAGGTISITDRIATFSTGSLLGGDGGDVILTAGGTISFNCVSACEISSFTDGKGNVSGGNVSLSSDKGDILTSITPDLANQLASRNVSPGIASFVRGTGNPGTITLSAPQGKIDVAAVELNSVAVEAGKGGAIILTAGNDVTTGSRVVSGSLLSGGSLSITSGGSIDTRRGELDASSTSGTGSFINLIANRNIETGNIRTDGPLGGGAITLTSQNGFINTGILRSSSINGSGGAITLNAANGLVNSADLTSFGTTGGNVSVIAQTQITTGAIDTSATVGNGGNVLLDPAGDIQVTSINAQGGSAGRGGNVDITTQSFFRSTDRFIDRNNRFASISTAGGAGGGDITIRHGGQGITPFVIGDASLNGTAGVLTTGSDNIIAQSNQYYFTYTQPAASGTIRIISVEPPTTKEPLLPLDPGLLQPCDLENNIFCELEEYFTREYDRYFQRPNTPIKSLGQVQQELRDIERETGVKPALIYVFFTPRGLSPEDITHQVKSDNRAAPSSEAIWQFTAQGLSVTNTMKEQESGKGLFQIGCTPEDQVDNTQTKQAPVICEMELVLVTSDGDPILRRPPNSPQSEVLGDAREFHASVKDNDDDTIQAQKFYNWLITPLAVDLQQLGVDNLVFIMDAGLRTLPLAAMRQERFLLDDYSIGMMPSMSLTDTRHVSVKKARPLLMGASNFKTQARLPAVELELLMLSELYPDNKFFFNEAFTKETLASEGGNVQLIHLATHGSFQSGDPANSYILLGGDNKLYLKDIQQFSWTRPSVELLVLSACETAKGDEEVELGFAGVAVQVGVKTSLASLWVVPDGETVPFMTEFYRQLQEAPIKAEALRRTQNKLRKDQWQTDLASLLNVVQKKDLLSPDSLDIVKHLQETSLSRPKYWATFTLIGNPW